MIDTGTGLAILGIGTPLAAALIKAIPQRQPSPNGKYVLKEVCQVLHKALEDMLADIKRQNTQILAELTAYREDVIRVHEQSRLVSGAHNTKGAHL